MTMELTDTDKARIVLESAKGHIVSNEDFERVAMSLKSCGISDGEIDEFMRQSPGYDSTVRTRIKSFRADGKRGIGTLVQWAKDAFNFSPSWHGEKVNLTTYPVVTNSSRERELPKLPKWASAEVPQKYAHLPPLEQLKMFIRQIRTDADLSQLRHLYYGAGWKTNLVHISQIEDAQSISDIENAMGAKFDAQAGGWIAANPCFDENAKVESVSDFRYLVWEGDKVPFEEQWGNFINSHAPIAAVVYSGGKSLHALVEVNARDKDEYADIAERFFNALKRRGADFDPACKNPNRLTRLPGIYRGENLQNLVALKADFADACATIRAWLEAEENPPKPEAKKILPEPDSIDFNSVIDDSEYLIGKSIMKGEVVCIGGDQKIGKSWMAEQLAAELVKPFGGYWLGMPIREHESGRGHKVFFLNAEIAKPSFNDRMKKVFRAANAVDYAHNFKSVTLRAVAEKINAWKQELKQMILNFGADCVIVDPIYTLLDGDENSAEDVTALMVILREIAVETGVTMFITHHHRKGDMEQLDIAQRLAGSNAVARFCDSIIDLCSVRPDYLRAGGIETSIVCDDDGLEHIKVRGLCIEYMLRNGEDIAPRFFWRYDGGTFREDAAGALKCAWHSKQKTSFNSQQIAGVFSMLGERVKLSGSVSDEIRQSYTQKETGETLVETRLKEAAEAGVGITVKSIVELTGLSRQRVQQVIKAYSDNNCILIVNPDRRGNEPPEYAWKD